MPVVTHDTAQYANNRAEVSHQPTRQRERQMRGFTSPAHAQHFLHRLIQNLFRVGRHLLKSAHHRMLRARSFTVWAEVTAASSADQLASSIRDKGAARSRALAAL
jgi:putative transposase